MFKKLIGYIIIILVGWGVITEISYQIKALKMLKFNDAQIKYIIENKLTRSKDNV